MSDATKTVGPAASDKKSDIRKVKVGSVFSRHSFGSVERTSPWEAEVKNTHGLKWTVSGDLIEKEFQFADQFDVELHVTRTNLIDLLRARPFTAMTVTFRKKVDMKDAATDIWSKIADPTIRDTPKAFEKLLTVALAGEVRVMAGYHSGEADAHGRIKFTEILAGGESQQRLIDPRTVEEVICARAKHLVKD